MFVINNKGYYQIDTILRFRVLLQICITKEELCMNIYKLYNI